MDQHGDDGQVEVVEHDVDMLMDASLEAKVQAQRPAADALQGAGVLRPGGRDRGQGTHRGHTGDTQGTHRGH